METIVRAETEAPTERGWFYARHHLQPDFPIEPHRVLMFANGLAVPNGGGFAPVSDFHWFGPVPSVQSQQ